MQSIYGLSCTTAIYHPTKAVADKLTIRNLPIKRIIYCIINLQEQIAAGGRNAGALVDKRQLAVRVQYNIIGIIPVFGFIAICIASAVTAIAGVKMAGNINIVIRRGGNCLIPAVIIYRMIAGIKHC